MADALRYVADHLARAPGPAPGSVGPGRRPQGRRAGHPRKQGPDRLGAIGGRSSCRSRVFGAGHRPAVREGRDRAPFRIRRRPPRRLAAAAPEQFIHDLNSGVGHLRRIVRRARRSAWSASASAADWCGDCWAPARWGCRPPFRSTGRCPTTRTSPGPRPRCWASTAPWTPGSPARKPAAKAALDRAGLVNELVVEPNADHAFFNDTGPRYNAAAAADAWQRTVGLVRPLSRSAMISLRAKRSEPSTAPDPAPPAASTSRAAPGCPPASGARRPHVGETVEEGPQPDFALGAGQRRAQAEVAARGKREMLSGIGAFDVEAVRVGEHRRVAIGGGQVNHHHLAAA